MSNQVSGGAVVLQAQEHPQSDAEQSKTKRDLLSKHRPSGMTPDTAFPEILNSWRDLDSTRASISTGIFPVKIFLATFNELKVRRFPTVVGSGPERSVLFTEDKQRKSKMSQYGSEMQRPGSQDYSCHCYRISES